MKTKFLFAALLLTAMCFADVATPTWQLMDNPCIGQDGDGNPWTFPQTQGGAAIYGDYNNDGYLDMFFCTGNALFLYTNDGTGKYTVSEPDFCEKLFGSAAIWIDYDNDGDLDIILTGSMDETSAGVATYVIQNSGAPDYTFEEDMENFMEGCWPENKENTLHTIAALDYDHDGWMDVVLNGQAGGNWEEGYDGARMVALYHNNKGIFELAHGHDTFHQMNGSSVFAGDANNDGWMDILVSGYYDEIEGSTSELYINQKNGTFQLASGIPFTGHQQGSTLCADLNNDGYQDIIEIGRDVTGGWVAFASILLGKGDGTFTEVELPDLAGGAATTIGVGDLNNDGIMDIAYNGWPTQAVAYGNGDGTFKEVNMSDDNVLDKARARGGYLNFVDFNGDNTLDFYNYGYRDGGDGEILFSAWPNYQVLNMLGNGISANAAPAAPTNVAVEKTEKGYKLTWDAATDDHTVTAAMRYNVYMKSGDKTFVLAPADLATGKLKVAGATIPTLITGTSYEFIVPEGNYEFGVQAIDQSNVTSAFGVPTTTALENINGTTLKVSKSVRKGMMVIERNGKFYNAIGTEL